MKTVRFSITLPGAIAKKLGKVTKTRTRSAVIAEALELYFNQDKTKDLFQEMVEGYIATQKEDLILSKNAEGSIAEGL